MRKGGDAIITPLGLPVVMEIRILTHSVRKPNAGDVAHGIVQSLKIAAEYI